MYETFIDEEILRLEININLCLLKHKLTGKHSLIIIGIRTLFSDEFVIEMF